MSPATATPTLWRRQESREAARERLHDTVAALARARHLQLIVDHAFAGLLTGLCLATLAVLALRLGALPLPPGMTALVTVAVALAGSLAIAAWRRPDPLQVAIRADVALRLKQRLSTAWELVCVEGDTELSDRLAAHAVKAGLPGQCASVFPLRVNRWGRLAPLALTALLLASLVDLDRLQVGAPRAVDEHVIDEGERLRAFGRDMQARAQREALPRSALEASELERLGGRMQSGGLSRGEALAQLRRMAESLEQSRAQALADAGAGTRAGAGHRAASSGRDAGAVAGRSPRAPSGGDGAAAPGGRLDDIERAGAPRRALQRPLEHPRAGVDEPLDELLAKLPQIEQALREDEEMRRALEAVRRSQDALGARSAKSAAAGERAGLDPDEDDGAESVARSGATAADQRGSGEPALQMPRTGSQGDSVDATARAATPLAPKPSPQGPVLSAAGQLGEGESFASEARILPRTNRPAAPESALSAQYAAQLESVLADERYPAHYKAFVRRYFLALSEGERRGQP